MNAGVGVVGAMFGAAVVAAVAAIAAAVVAGGYGGDSQLGRSRKEQRQQTSVRITLAPPLLKPQHERCFAPEGGPDCAPVDLHIGPFTKLRKDVSCNHGSFWGGYSTTLKELCNCVF